MKNLKTVAVATDGSFKRIAMSYDEINNGGTATAINKRVNRVVTDVDVLAAIDVLENHAKKIINEQED